MLGGSPSSPFRAGTGHRAPWPPPSLPAAEGFGRFGVSGGLYSLFPGSADSGATVYPQAASTARFSHSNTYHSFIGSHKVADSLFSTGYTFGGPTPPPSTASGSFTPLVERGITQLELMAKGFNNNNNNSNSNNANNNNGTAEPVQLPATKKQDCRRRADCQLVFQDGGAAAERRGAAKRRWERDGQPAPGTPPAVKSEVTSRPSCGCRRANNNVITGSPPFPPPAPGERRHQQGGGCSRTTPVSLRAAPDWGGVAVKKEPGGGGSTPCQVAEVTTSLRQHAAAAASPAPLIKVEGARKEAQHFALNALGSIPVGIAVARQRLQDAASKPALVLAAAPEQPPPASRHHKAPAPEPTVSQDLAAVVLQPQCEDRVANGIAPWAAATTHNPALTPPTLWQYPASVPVQLGPAEHLPLPPVGYQLVRDPISGHYLLIPTTNIEHLQRTVLWPGYPAAIQQALPAAQHIQLFEAATDAGADFPAQAARILVQPQLTIAAAPAAPVPPPAPEAARRGPAPAVKVEDCDEGAKAHRHRHAPPRALEAPGVASQLFYDHAAAVVQLAQTPQPSTSVQTDNGKRSQATSPVNPAETCLTPPPEAGATHSEGGDSAGGAIPAEAPVQVQDASNQTDAPPAGEDEACDAGAGKQPSPSPPPAPLPPPPATQADEMVDLSGLELLSNSIEQFESARQNTATPPGQAPPEPGPSVEKAAETLQLLCQQLQGPEPGPAAPAAADGEKGGGALGGLGLLCALAEQRFMEEVASGRPRSPVAAAAPGPPGVDVNRNYRTRESERECKRFIASKVLQYYQGGHRSGSSSPQPPGGACRSPSSADFMDAMELDMRMRLAELQRKYREKQRELSRLTPRKPGSESGSSGVTSPEAPPSHRAKRGPGRPRKRCNRLALDSPPPLARPRGARPRDPPPPVLERATDAQRPRPGPEHEDCAVPRLKASRLDILKPPTLTANRILTCARPAPKDAAGRPLKTNGAITKDSNKGKLSPLSFKDSSSALDKLSAFASGRLPLTHAPSHTFGSKPSTCLLGAGDTESLFWFKSSEKSSCFGKLLDRSSPEVENWESASLKFKSSTPPPPASPAGTPSSSKKRKVGRPKKHHLSASGHSPATETIVAKKPRSKGLLLSKGRPKPFETGARGGDDDDDGGPDDRSLSFSKLSSTAALGRAFAPAPDVFKPATGTEDARKPSKIRPKLKAEAKVKAWSWREDDDWPAAAPERSQPAPAHAWTKKTEKTEKIEKTERPAAPTEAPGRPQKRRPGGDAKGPRQRPAPASRAKEKDKRDDAAGPAKKARKGSAGGRSSGGGTSESEDLPLSVLSRLGQASCALTQANLNVDKQRALAVMGGLFYAGTIGAIRAPDVYGITLDGERGNRPHIFSREEILRDAILEVRAASVAALTPGTRVCAYWSQQYRCLYPGTVAEPSSPDPELDAQFVSVEFDDGDNGRISVDDVRLLPADYPIVEYDPNPLLSLGKRRRRNSGTSCESHSKDRRTGAEATTVTGPKAASQGGAKGGGDDDQVSGAAPGSEGPRPDDAAGVESREEGKKSRLQEEQRSKDERPCDLSSRERRRLKKRRREKLKRLLSCSGAALSCDGPGRRRHRRHRCGDERPRHKRHHRRRHRRHKHRHKDSSAGSSGETSSKTSGDAVASSRLSPVLEQLDVLEIQQTAIHQLQAAGGGGEDAQEPAPETAGPAGPASDAKKGKKDKEVVKAKKGRERQPSGESRSKMAAFLPARQLWGWSGRGFKRPGAKGRGKKEFFKAIQRGKETIRVGDCAVFLSTGRPDRPYIGRIESMWESWGTNMVVRVKWFYHPEETNGCPAQLKYPGALFESPHADENDVQTISHKCEVLPLAGYTRRLGSQPQRYSTVYDNNDVYYLAGYYDPTTSQLTMEPGVL